MSISNQVSFLPKAVGETLIYTVDFASRLAVGVTISTQVVTATVYSGTDASPSAIVSGSATASGTIVSQKLTAGTSGVVYLTTWTITTSDSQTVVMFGLLAVVPDVV